MVELVELQALAYVAQVIGVAGTLIAAFVGVRSYINSNKRAEEARKRELETRQAQLFMQIFIINQGKELLEAWAKIYSTEIKDPESLAKKLYESPQKKWRDLLQTIGIVATYYDGVGIYAKKGLIDIEMVRELMAGDYIMMWEKLKPLLVEIRKITPFSVEGFEWLYNRLKETQRPTLIQSKTV